MDHYIIVCRATYHGNRMMTKKTIPVLHASCLNQDGRQDGGQTHAYL